MPIGLNSYENFLCHFHSSNYLFTFSSIRVENVIKSFSIFYVFFIIMLLKMLAQDNSGFQFY